MEKTRNRIIAILIIIWIIGSFVGFAFAMQSDGLRWLGFVLLGQLFLIFGIAGMVALIRDKAKGAIAMGFVALFGGVFLFFGLMERFASDQTYQKLVDHLLLISGGIVGIAGFTGLIALIVSDKRKQAKYATPIDAVCIAHKRKPGQKTFLIDPVYRITWKETVYELDNYVYRSGFAPEIGETRTLLIDENDIGGYFDPDEYAKDRALRILLRGVFILIALLGCFLIFLFFLTH